MKRLHLHVGVADLDRAIRFYSTVFGADPIKRKWNYAKWELEDPRINFAISTRPHQTGLNHLGIQVDDAAELEAIRDRVKRADLALFDEGETDCCYARSDKSWVRDPAGIPWEAYRTMEDVEIFEDTPAASRPAAAPTCDPGAAGRGRQSRCCA